MAMYCSVIKLSSLRETPWKSGVWPMSKYDVKGGDCSSYPRAPAPCQAQETLLKAVWDVQAKAGPEFYKTAELSVGRSAAELYRDMGPVQTS